MHISFSDIVVHAEGLDNALQAKHECLQDLVRQMKRVVVAFSGGVDSTLALKIALDTLGSENALAVIAVSPSLPARELDAATTLLDEMNARYELIETHEVEDRRYAENPANRCYFCKVHVGDALLDAASARGFEYIVDGFNRDDTGDHRPGRKAGRERGIRSPLYEAELGKVEVRKLARFLGLPNWNKPAMACLSSRVPYGSAITPAILKQIDDAEYALEKMGFPVVRVRHYDQLARIEIPESDFLKLLECREAVLAALQQAGYNYITLDLQGFRSGSMNEALTANG